MSTSLRDSRAMSEVENESVGTCARKAAHVTAMLSLLAGVAACIAVFSIPNAANAVSTRILELDDWSTFSQGEVRGVAAHSSGRLVPASLTSRIALPADVAMVQSLLRVGDDIFVGTGNDGKIYRLQNDRVELWAETHQLLVVSMVHKNGVLYAGTMPEGRVFAIRAQGQVDEVCRLGQEPPGATDLAQAQTPSEAPSPRRGSQSTGFAESVWALAIRENDNHIYAATGPYGQVFSIDPSARPDARQTLLWDSESAAHIMSLAVGARGELFAGTSDDALVVRIEPQARAAANVRIVYDFPGNEITSLLYVENVGLYVAANEFPDVSAPTTNAVPTKRTANTPHAARPRPGKGRVYLWNAVGSSQGQVERIFAQEEGHVTHLAQHGQFVFAALGHDGRVVRIANDHSYAVWLDVDERQITTSTDSPTGAVYAAGDGAALYRERTRTSNLDDAARWTCKVLDLESEARFGNLAVRANGSVEVRTRSGNSERPGPTWSDWSGALTASGPIRSPAGRFLQIQVQFPNAVATSELRGLSVYYLPQNQRASVSEVMVKNRPSKITEPATPNTTLPITWRTENPDGDRLRFRLRFREESQSLWRPITRESESLTTNEYSWNTTGIPDGLYVVEVEASDELANPIASSERDRAESEPIRVDNHPPRIENLRSLRAGLGVECDAVDSLGPIFRIEYAVNGGDFRMATSDDGLLDAAREHIRVVLDASAEVPAGATSVLVAVRATDANGNAAVGETVVTVTRSERAR